MLKKLLTALVALMMGLTCLACAEEESIWLQEGSLAETEDGAVLLHLMLGKQGGPVRLDDVGVAFLSGEGQPVRMDAVALVSAVTVLPEGEVFFPVTIRATPAQGEPSVAEFRVTGLYTSVPEPGEAPRMAQADGFFLMKGPETDEVTAFTDAWAGEDPSVYSGYAFIYDRAGRYLGNVFLPQGSGGFVAGERMLATLARALRWEEKTLMQAGFPANAPDCILFGGIPMTGLPEGAVPGGAEVFVCAAQETETQTKTLSIVDFTLEAADGAFTIRATALNTSDETVRLTGVPYVAMHDEGGNVRLCTEVTLLADDAVYAPGATGSFTLTGTVEEGFVPVACAFVTECEPESTK